MVIVTMRHARAAGLCGGRQFRKWFAEHNLDWSDFLKNGISSDILEKTNDSIVTKVVEIAREQQ